MRVFYTYAELRFACDLAPDAPGAFRFLPAYGPAGFRCSQCQKTKRLPTDGKSGGTGYAVTRDDAAICYACASENERAAMVATGKATLYLTGIPAFGLKPKPGERLAVGDWTGGIKLPVRGHSIGRHNIARRRYDVWFTGPDGNPWRGVTYGDNTQICHCRRINAFPKGV
jgi:hypothetical protein